MFPALDRWGNVRGASRAMRPCAVADVIRQRAAAIGLRVSGNSLRVGAAVSMAARGASLVAMQAPARDRSPRFGPKTGGPLAVVVVVVFGAWPRTRRPPRQGVQADIC